MTTEELIQECHEGIVDICRHYIATGEMDDKGLRIQLRKLDRAWERFVNEFIEEEVK